MGRTKFSRFALAVSSTLVIGFVSTWAIAKQHDDTQTQNGIFYTDQKAADAALVQFANSNPDCQLWTNWEKMCSRTSGASTCIRDSRLQVRPSTPFCVISRQVNWQHVEKQHSVLLMNETRSIERFCLPNEESQHDYLRSKYFTSMKNTIGYCTFKKIVHLQIDLGKIFKNHIIKI